MSKRKTIKHTSDTGANLNGGGPIQLKRDNRGAPAEGGRLQISIVSSLYDRWEGLSTTEMVWADTPNARYVTEMLANAGVRTEVAAFFNERRIVNVLDQLIKTVMLKPNETAYTKIDYAKAVSEHGGVSKFASSAIVELSLPVFLKLGLVSSNIKYSHQIEYGFDRVTVTQLRHDVAMFEVVKAVKNVSLSGIDANAKVSKTVFAEAIGEALRSIGLAIYEIVDLARVMDDIIRGVRANIDHTMASSTGAQGSVPTDWKNHRVVAELSQNLVFIRAALALPVNYSMAIENDSWKLEKWAPVVLTAIKSSARYAWVSKAEMLRHHTLRKVRNLKGKVVAAVLSRRVEVQPIAQAVFAIPDVAMKDTYNITATKDRIAEVVQAAYGSATFSTDIGADLLASTVTDAVQMGWQGNFAGYAVDTEGDGFKVEDVALLLANRVFVPVTDKGIELDPKAEALRDPKTGDVAAIDWNPAWWFVVTTRELDLDVWSGRHLGTEVITSDPIEALMATPDFEARDALPPRPQMLSAAAFNTRVLDFDEEMIRRVDARYTFKVDIVGAEVHGTFRAVDFASLRSGEATSLVLPHFNDGVVRGLQHSFAETNKMLQQMERDSEGNWLNNNKPSEAFFSFMRHRTARELLKLAQKLAPAFRQEVHTTMIERALLSTQAAGNAATTMRAVLAQKTFAAFADVVALHFFLFLQGIDAAEWHEIIQSREMIETCMEMGSDRS